MESDYEITIDKNKITEAFAEFGIKAYDDEGNFRGFILLDELADAWSKSMEDEE